MKNIQTSFRSFINESSIKIPKTKISGEFFHGTCIEKGDKLFTSLKPEYYSDWTAIWVADDESVAEEFSSWKSFDESNYIKAVYRLKINLNKIAVISYELSKDLLDEYCVSDLREMIPFLEKMGFNGWETTGSLGHIEYNDYAIFDPSKIDIQEVKIFINDDWTDYMPIEEANELLETI